MTVFQFQSIEPDIHASAYIAPTATVIGDVKIRENASVWFNCVLRGDVENVDIGMNTNIQDLTMVHTDSGKPTHIGNFVSIGHGCVIHGCTIEDNCLIGMGSTILSGAVIGSGSVVAAGSVILENADIPPNAMVAGVPGKFKRDVDNDLRQSIKAFSDRYVNRAKIYSDDRQVFRTR
jgi:carbonic anhydrase/acetyltransferase-like protein (isoleucine patch superfamily)